MRLCLGSTARKALNNERIRYFAFFISRALTIRMAMILRTEPSFLNLSQRQRILKSYFVSVQKRMKTSESGMCEPAITMKRAIRRGSVASREPCCVPVGEKSRVIAKHRNSSLREEIDYLRVRALPLFHLRISADLDPLP